MTVFFFNYSKKKKTNFLFAGCETSGGELSFLVGKGGRSWNGFENDQKENAQKFNKVTAYLQYILKNEPR